jgi:DNA-binding LytR/AlgR family response regulator
VRYKCVIVDDEPLALDVLESFIQKVPELELVGICHNAIEAMAMLRQHEVDILFLDIQMPEINGMDMVRSIKSKPAVVFTTAYTEHAIQAFELDAIDYLLKPISFERFIKAVNKAIHYVALGHKEQLPADVQHPPLAEEEDYIFVKADKKIIKIKLDDVHYIEGLKDYVMIYTTDQRIITLQTMKNLEERLPSNKFLRVHRSFIISLDKLKSVVGNAVEIKDKLIPLGKHYRDDFMRLVEKHNFIK